MGDQERCGAAAGAFLLLLLLPACATPDARAPEPPPQGEPREEREEPVRYAIELVDPETPLVAIEVEARGDSDGTSDFTLNEGWAGLTDSGKDLELADVQGAAGGLAHERVNAYTFRVKHAPGETLRLTFELGPTTHRAHTGPPEYYLPILERGLLHLIGAQALPAPAHLDFGRERPISLCWRGFAQAGWKVVSSFATGEDEFVATRSLDEFRHALFLAGDLRLLPGEVHGRPVWVAMAGEWAFSDEEFAALARRIVALGREFFEDFGQPYFLISLIPVGTGEERGSYGGTGLTDSFALFLTRDVTLQKTPGAGGIAWLLAHELFHTWNGQVISLEQPEELGYWFSEGFTDFYARRLLQRAGLLEREEVLESWNHKLAAQAANPERHASAERVREAFWTVREVGDVPYQRGDLIALFVDHAIRRHSAGERSLDDLLRELVRRARGGAGPFSNDELLAAIGEFAGDEAAAAVRRWALEGVEAVLAPDAAGPGYELVAADVPTFDTGFDHERALKEGVVTGVRAGGPAEQAGVREGMRLAGWSVNYGRTDVPLELRVREGDAQRTFSYLPRGPGVPGYRLEPRGAR